MGNGMRVPMSAVRGGKLIAKGESVEVRIVKFRYCANVECEAYGRFWTYNESKEMRHCPTCSEKGVNHTLDSEQRREMLQMFASSGWSYARGDIVWKMIGVVFSTERPINFTLKVIPTRLFIGYVDAGARVAVFGRPVLKGRLSPEEAEAAVVASENLRSLIEASEDAEKTEEVNE